MKLTISRLGLGDITAHAANGVPATAEASKPVLAGMRLEAASGHLTAWATDYNTTFRWTATAEVGEPGAVVPPAGMLRRIIDNLPAGPVEMETAGDGTLVLSGGTAGYEMPLLVAADYPSPPSMPDPLVTFDRFTLLTAIERTAFSADPKNAEPHRAVVRIEPDMDAGTLTLIATDVFRISVTPVRWLAAEGPVPAAYIRADLLQRWAHALKSGGGQAVTIGFAYDGTGTSVMVLRDGSKEASARCMKLPEYVNWAKASQLPEGEYLTATVDSAGLATVARRVGTFLPPTSPLWLTFADGEVRVATSRAEGRVAGADTFPVGYDGPRFQAAFNAARLEEGLSAMGGRTQIVMTTATRPAFLMRVPDGKEELSFEDKAFRHVVMPFGRSTEKPPE